MSYETPQFLALYSFSSSSLKASVHSSRLPFDEAGWRKLHVKPARANGLRLEGRLTSRAKHPSHPGWWGLGGGIPQNKGACFPSPKALEGTAISWALCGPSVPNLAPLPPQLWHAFRTVLLFIMPGSWITTRVPFQRQSRRISSGQCIWRWGCGRKNNWVQSGERGASGKTWELSHDLEPGCVKYTMWTVNVPYIKLGRRNPMSGVIHCLGMEISSAVVWTWGEWLPLSVASSSSNGLVWVLNVIIHVKCLAQRLIHSKAQMNVKTGWYKEVLRVWNSSGYSPLGMQWGNHGEGIF